MPDLLITCTGGTEYFTMNDALEKEFVKDISLAATTKGMTRYFVDLKQLL